MKDAKRRILSAAMLLVVILSIVGCKSAKEKSMNENREFIDLKYRDAIYLNYDADTQKADELKNGTKKDKFIKWTAHIRKIKDENTLYLQDGLFPEIQAEFSYDIKKDNNYAEGDLITISGNVYDYVTEGVFISSKWKLKNCRIEETTEEDKKDVENFLKEFNDIDKPKEETNAESKIILGSTRDEIIKLFSDYKIGKAYDQYSDAKALRLENKDQLVVVDFDSNGKAEGVSFLSSDTSGDGKNSYVNKHYDELIKLATGGKDVKVDRDVSSKYPIEIYIGNVHD